jgi:hypothetical protein
MAGADLSALWRGEMPLAIAFWRYMLTYGLVLNLGSSLAFLIVFLAQGPPALALLFHLLPIPYNAISAVGVWRSAVKAAPSALTTPAQLAACVWFLIWLVL